MPIEPPRIGTNDGPADPTDAPRVLNIPQSFDRINDLWSPHIAARVNGQDVRLAKIDGAFDWHFHDGADEAFMVVKGAFTMEFRQDERQWATPLGKGDMLVVPAGMEHRPVAADGECWIVIIENSDVVNTGNVRTSRTKDHLPHL